MTKQTEALKLALYELEGIPVYRKYGVRISNAITAIKEALAQPKQEPAKLWCETCEGTGQVYQEHQAGCHVGGHFKCPDCDGEGHIVSRLYSTTPPKRTWVGLTDAEMWELWNSQGDDAMEQQAATAFARAIEAKLKEKNT